MKPINSLPPFKRFCVTIGNLPSSYVDSMSYYECIMWLCKYLKDTVIPAVNENAEAVNELINWFNNLDVQDEVNNKLDEMAESGELEEIISVYLNSKAIFTFDNVEDMKSATNLIDGSSAETLGFNEINDGGGNLYKIKTITTGDVVDDKNVIAINNELIAVKIDTSTIINVKDFGAYGDGIHDDTSVIQYCIDKFVHRTIFIPDGHYLISSPLSIKAGNDYQVNIEMSENAKLFTNTTIDSIIEIGKVYGGAWDRYSEGNCVVIKGGLIDCNNVKYGIYSNGDQKYTQLQNLNMINIDRYGIYLDRGSHTNISNDTKIYNCCLNGKTSATSNEGTGIYIYGSDNTLDNITMLRMKVAFDIKGGGNKISNIHICTAWDNDITDEQFNNTIAFRYENVTLENLSNIYLDTYAIGFQLNGNNDNLNITNVVDYYWYAGNNNIQTKLFDINTTISSNNRIYADNIQVQFPNSNGRNNVLLDLDNAGSGYREFLPCYESIFIDNISYDIDRVSANDYMNVCQIRKQNGMTLLTPWTLTMNQNQYYPIAIVNRGFHDFDFRQDNTVYAHINVNVTSTISNSTITNETIEGASSSLSLALLDIGLTDYDNRPLLILAIKTTATGQQLNPAVDNVKNSWAGRLYTYRRFPTNSGLDLTNATVISSSDL